MKKHIIITHILGAMLMICSLPVAAQKNFTAGFVVLNSGDTLEGLIKNEDWKVNPDYISFKSSSDQKAVKYTPHDIRMFRFSNGPWYVSYQGWLSGSSLNGSQLNYNPQPIAIRDTLFLRVLVAGKSNLLYALDRSGRPHYFMQQNIDSITELQYHKYLSQESGMQVKTITGFRDQLSAMVADCPTLADEFIGLPLSYDRDDLMMLFRKYNDCHEQGVTYLEPNEKWDLDFSIAGGIYSSQLNFSGTGTSFEETLDMDKASSWMAGLGLNVTIPRTRQHFSLNGLLFYKGYEAYGNTTKNLNDPEDAAYMNFQYLKLATTFRASIPKLPVRPMVGVGITNAYALKAETRYTNTVGTVTEFIKDPRRYEFGAVAEAGLSVRHFYILAMFETSNGISPAVHVHSRVHTFYGMAGFTF